jgi:hypothetical protein
MLLKQAFTARDQMNKQALYKHLASDPATMAKIQAAFEDGERLWQRHLVSVFGESEARRMEQMLSREV